MDYQTLVERGLDGGPLRLILRGAVEEGEGGKVGSVSVVYATMSRAEAERRLLELSAAATPGHYYMVYGVPLDTDLTLAEEFPSIVVTRDDLE